MNIDWDLIEDTLYEEWKDAAAHAEELEYYAKLMVQSEENIWEEAD